MPVMGEGRCLAVKLYGFNAQFGRIKFDVFDTFPQGLKGKVDVTADSLFVKIERQIPVYMLEINGSRPCVVSVGRSMQGVYA